ncbi:phage tail protein [Ralstonia syzygii]|uniref:phage tail protein n=1 Tax=Ralstonia syzygii TaxID=28097 RepID=UPI003517C3B5
MPVSQQGAINTTALYVPDVYVQIVPPSENFLNGLPTNILGIVGTAQWGPVNAPTIVGSLSDYVQQFGNIQARKYDMGTAVWAAVLNGANNMRCVRVTDGTDVAASVAVLTNCITFTAKYTGTLGNSLQVTIANGSKANSWKAVVAMPGLVPEVYDNIGAGLTGNALWIAIASAINNGIDGLRGKSGLIVATAGAGTTAPTAATYTLAGGTDGTTTITGSTLVGVDTIPRKGMYALRGTYTSVAMLTDCDDSTTWSTQVAFGLSEGIYMIATGPAGDTITNAISVKATAGIDSYAMKLLFGDWVYFLDTVNSQTRLISPQGFVAGRLSGLSPEQSSLNKPLYGIVGTQKSYQNLTYSQAELQALAQAGIDLITNPIPAGNSFGVRIGVNTSSNAVIDGDNYTRMTNYIAYTLNGGMGLYVGRLQSPKTRNDAFGTVNAFMSNLWQQGMIGDVNDPQKQPFSIQLDKNNNPSSRVALGYMQIDCRVTYLSVITKLIINVEGGQSVKVSVASITPQ